LFYPVMMTTLDVIIRLVRNCALGRMIQYAAAIRFFHQGRGELDTPLSRGMTATPR